MKNLKKRFSPNKDKGFTLLEMLIVIGIIAVIITIVSVSYATAQKKSRDSRRKSDLKSIQNALEQYYSVCGYVYPSLGPNSLVPTIGCSSSSVVLMPTAASDPRTATPYPMTTSTLNQYKVCALLESEQPSDFCITNQQ